MRFLRTTLRISFGCKVSREMLKGGSPTPIFRVNDTLDILGNETFTIAYEHTANVKVALEEIEHEDNGLEFGLILNREELDSEVISPVVGKALVERPIPEG